MNKLKNLALSTMIATAGLSIDSEAQNMDTTFVQSAENKVRNALIAVMKNHQKYYKETDQIKVSYKIVSEPYIVERSIEGEMKQVESHAWERNDSIFVYKNAKILQNKEKLENTLAHEFFHVFRPNRVTEIPNYKIKPSKSDTVFAGYLGLKIIKYDKKSKKYIVWSKLDEAAAEIYGDWFAQKNGREFCSKTLQYSEVSQILKYCLERKFISFSDLKYGEQFSLVPRTLSLILGIEGGMIDFTEPLNQIISIFDAVWDFEISSEEGFNRILKLRNDYQK